MEFVGNQITLKNVLATLMVAFFIGRINLFGGSFPAAIALITVMAAVSTVYIYLVPVMALAMMTWHSSGVDFYGDLAALIFCGMFFLFFHTRKFTINQRTSAAVIFAIGFNFAYYAYEDMLYMLRPEYMLMEVLAVVVYIRVFNTIARALFVGNADGKTPISSEKLGLALSLAIVSIIGSIGIEEVVFPLWIFMILVVLTGKGIQWAMTSAAAAAVFWQCQFNPEAEKFLPLFAAIICGWFLASLVESQYRKSVLVFTVFMSLAFSAGEQIFGIAIVCAGFAVIPLAKLTELWCKGAAWISPKSMGEFDKRMLAINEDLLKKRDTFKSLGKLYSVKEGSRQIVSYQFEGMARTVDEIIRGLDLAASALSAPAAGRAASIPSLFVGGASYAAAGVSGDSSLSFSYGKNHQAIVISDGMGKGSRAAAESSMIVTTLSKLLAAGFDVDLAMKTVNAILMNDDSGEMFASVDLCIINKETLRAQIYKMGAASTFLKHDGKVSMLKRPALPVGVTEGVKLEYIDVRLRKGDILVMVSDGITDCDRGDPDCRWLSQRLAEIGSRSPDTVAELLLSKAAEKYGIRERDDLTVMVVAI